MLTRILSGLVYATLLLVAAHLGGLWWIGLVALLALLAVHEAYGIERQAGRAPLAPIGWLLAPGLVLASPDSAPSSLAPMAIVLAIYLASMWQIRQAPEQRSTPAWMATLVYPVCLGSLLCYLAALRTLGGPEAGLAWLLLLFALIWSNDSGAYLGGRLYGRRPFFPTVSPKKTWEGALSGALASLLVAWALPSLAGLVPALAPLGESSPWLRLALGGAVSLLGPAGDLSQSVLKRQAGVKDSGTLIPGHGGILDRIDSLLFAAPVVYLVLSWLAG